MNKILALTATLALCLLTACGGGGGSSSSSSSGSSSSGSGSGSSGSGSSGGSTSSNATNVATVTVDQGPTTLTNTGTVATNTLYVSVTICVPGSTTNCQTIDHVQVDTGSTGLRILSSALTTVTGLTNVTATSGGALAECMQYADGVAWGPVVTADMYVGGSNAAGSGEKAASIPVEIIGGSNTNVPSTPPSACTSSGTLTVEDTVATFGANGIIGVGSFQQDCGVCCTSGFSSDGCSANAGFYYGCTSSSCSVTTEELTAQVSNPVSLFTTTGDDTGVIISLPTVGTSGAATVTGTLTFGIGTQSNNAKPSTASLLWLDPFYGEFETTYNGSTITCPYSSPSDIENWCSYIDSGSNALYFVDSNIVVCTTAQGNGGFFCPASTVSETATQTSYAGTGSSNATGGNSNVSADFSIANAGTLFSSNTTYAAFSNLGGCLSAIGTSNITSTVCPTTSSNTFDWGLPYFYGKNVYVSMQTDTQASAGDSPYIAFTSNSGTVLNQ